MLINEKEVAIGKNGIPFGDDMKNAKVKVIEQLTYLAKWDKEVNRDLKTYLHHMWTLRNTADILGLNIDEMRAHAHKLPRFVLIMILRM